MRFEFSQSSRHLLDGPTDMMRAAVYGLQSDINKTIQLVNHVVPAHLDEINLVDAPKTESAWTKTGAALTGMAEFAIMHESVKLFPAARDFHLSKLPEPSASRLTTASDIAPLSTTEALSGGGISGASEIKRFEKFDPLKEPTGGFIFPQLMTPHRDGILAPRFHSGKLNSYAFGDKGAFLRNHNATVQILSETKDGVTYGGSGFFINANGFGVTNYHVISHSNDDFRIKTSDGKTHTGRLIATDKGSDLAIFGLVKNKGEYHKFEHVVFQANPRIRADENVYALGHPDGVSEQIYSRGEIKSKVAIASALDTLSKVHRGVMYERPKLANLSLTDVRAATVATIDLRLPAVPGSSGSPLFDSSGKLIGVLKDGNSHFSVGIGKGKTGATHARHIMAMFDNLPEKITGRYSMLSRVNIGSDGQPNVDIVKSKLLPLPPLERHRKIAPTLHWSFSNQFLFEN